MKKSFRIKVQDDSAQVRIPPPLVLLGAIALSWIMDWIWEFPVFHPGVHLWLGWTLFLGALAVAIWCVTIFRGADTAIPPWETTTTIVSQGPYRFSRNPIYLCMLVALAGVSSLFNTGWGFVLEVPFFLYLRYYVIEKEEAYLETKFKESYLKYKKTTRRWV